MNLHHGEYTGRPHTEIGMDLQDMPMQRGSVRGSTDLWCSGPRSHTQTNYKQTNLDNTDSGTERDWYIWISLIANGEWRIKNREQRDGRGRDNPK